MSTHCSVRQWEEHEAEVVAISDLADGTHLIGLSPGPPILVVAQPEDDLPRHPRGGHVHVEVTTKVWWTE